MGRILQIFVAIGTIVVTFAALSAGTYFVGGLAEEYLFTGASRLTNMVFLMLIFVMIMATLLTMAERKWSAYTQDRVGPNRARIGLPGLKNRALGGLPHIAADSLKMLFKEPFRPAGANENRALFALAPMLAFAPVFALFAIVPVGPTVPVNGRSVDMVVATPDFGLLYLLAIASLAVYGTSLAGWASNNKFALLGGVRASSQMISYEVALGLSLVGLMMAFSSLQLPAMVGLNAAETLAGEATGQARYLWKTTVGSFDIGVPAWGVLLQPLGFVLFFAAAFAETKRAPFDTPEGESEIIGYFVEYSGMQFGLFMISEFVEVVVLSGVVAALFFGGYHLPIGDEWLRTALADHPLLYGTIGATVFWIKVLLLCVVQLLIRWTFPRFRYDQIQTLGWKFLLPTALANVFVTGALILWDPSLRLLALWGLLHIGILVGLVLSSREEPKAAHAGHGGHGHGGPALGHGGGAHAVGHGAHAPALGAGSHASTLDTGHATATARTSHH